VVSTKSIDPWVLEFIVSKTTGNNQWENCISLDIYFRCLNRKQKNSPKLAKVAHARGRFTFVVINHIMQEL
jgi:hypothetical protein